MTVDLCVALSLAPALSRVGLTARLQDPDPPLLDLAHRYLPRVAALRVAAERGGIGVLPWNDPAFPQALLTLPDCPPALWFRGQVGVLTAPAVAVVGSRAATPVGQQIAWQLGADLAAGGVTVVSGLARGVDSAAHRGALTQGVTAAVLGSGPDWIYPKAHEGLADEIASHGVVLSEYPPGTAPLPFHFPQRNRLISGLARAVVLVEAAEKSGSLITAASALEQGRDVMVVPGNPLTGRNRGGHALLRDGAKIVECADDIVCELGLPGHDRGAAGGPPGPDGATTDPLAAVMDTGEVYDLDALTARLGKPAPIVLARLLELELHGIVRRVAGGGFIRPGRPC